MEDLYAVLTGQFSRSFFLSCWRGTWSRSCSDFLNPTVACRDSPAVGEERATKQAPSELAHLCCRADFKSLGC